MDRHCSVAGPILDWLSINGIIAIPCRPRSKSPVSAISRYGVYQDHPPSASVLLTRFGRERFGREVRDSFHLPTQERLNAIERFWQIPGVKGWGPDILSISIDMNYSTADHYTICCLDIDDEAHLPLLDDPVFRACPVVAGEKGGKGFFKLDRQGTWTRPITQFARPTSLTQGSPAFEIFTCSKHALVFGEHPAFSVERPIRYRITRGFSDPFPVIPWPTVIAALMRYARIEGLVVRRGTGPSLDQTDLSSWLFR
jgi:hypothetical protein